MSTATALESWEEVVGGPAARFADVPFDQKPLKTGLPPELREQTGDEPLATFLGVFSIGLGLWELLAPRGVARATGTPYPGLIRAYGLREIASGLGILTTPRPAGWLWARVAGDALDVGTLAAAYAAAGDDAARKRKVLAAGVAVLGVAALDVLAAATHSGSSAE